MIDEYETSLAIALSCATRKISSGHSPNPISIPRCLYELTIFMSSQGQFAISESSIRAGEDGRMADLSVFIPQPETTEKISIIFITGHNQNNFLDLTARSSAAA